MQHKSTQYFQFQVFLLFHLLLVNIWGKVRRIEKLLVRNFLTEVLLGQQLMTFTNVLIEFNLRHYNSAVSPIPPTQPVETNSSRVSSCWSAPESRSQLSLKLQNWFEFPVNVNVLQFLVRSDKCCISFAREKEIAGKLRPHPGIYNVSDTRENWRPIPKTHLVSQFAAIFVLMKICYCFIGNCNFEFAIAVVIAIIDIKTLHCISIAASYNIMPVSVYNWSSNLNAISQFHLQLLETLTNSFSKF